MTDVDTDSNAKAYSVSELAFALKRTLEDAYGFVRLRAELSKVTHHSNGHVYLTLKDDRAAIDGVVWKGSVRNLSVRPEQGLEVIVTGKITTYPAGSRYQIVIETMEAAGVGALLAQLERLKVKLQAEGLFEASAKRALPALPAVVGVITSPTGAVIRDILHRIRDRWPCRVIVWPVVVQGETAAAQVANAIARFNALEPGGPVPRPDIIIVARGGGSVEDLWAFNDEALARTVFAGTIPLISAVGHETDTTLIDFVSDRRAPTPTAAAEMATPVLSELRAGIADLSARLHRGGGRMVEDRRGRVQNAGRALARVPDLVEMAGQRFDLVASRLGAGLARNVAAHETALVRAGARLTPMLLQQPQRIRAERLKGVGERLTASLERSVTLRRNELNRVCARLIPSLLQRPQQLQADALSRIAVRLRPAVDRGLERAGERLTSLGKLYASVNPDAPLKRGFARVERPDRSLVREGGSLVSGESVRLIFADQAREATIDGTPTSAAAAAPKPARPAKPAATPSAQGDLF
ncbi:exodeoxyribonuclease VII large subunit [Phenylobacterium sp. LH3H17]|uniref:exodeoxyribonuclease VII large subunit n=1 Tax=Phenylobacterium sp. LH3H17 TaxID=2903901 RepID=UPI0020CA0679|nr:exodeoxyribonuclease VII large subunit [Phenylobacterium sp. LH3H17]UTP40426.1 exodeoxyribonuclease VII large subunit [Phenylobacterium sp. LH3H17]